MELLQRQNYTFNLPKKLQTAGIHRGRVSGMLADETKQIITNNRENTTIREIYIKKLFYQDKSLTVNEKNNDHLTEPSITKAEIEKAIQNS